MEKVLEKSKKDFVFKDKGEKTNEIELELYGGVKKDKGSKKTAGCPANLSLKTGREDTLKDLLRRLDITEDDIGHVFVNRKYLGLNKKAKALLAEELVTDSFKDHKIEDGDRIAIFPKSMSVFMF